MMGKGSGLVGQNGSARGGREAGIVGREGGEMDCGHCLSCSSRTFELWSCWGLSPPQAFSVFTVCLVIDYTGR